jgi:hypothetical protein
MQVASLTTLIVTALVTLPVPARAAERVTEDGAGAPDADPDPSPPDGQSHRAPAPETAAAALLRAVAAYEYGDMTQVVEAARPVAEGLLPASSDQHARALRLLGMGLYLTNRPRGAETAFAELLRKDPHARLDPTNTRPELVAFFENLRRRELTQRRRFIWNFVPPMGQFQNQDDTKGWIVLGVGVASLATLATSFFVLRSWQHEGNTFPGHLRDARTLKAVNWGVAGLLAATYLYGVVDGLTGYGRPLGDRAALAFRVFPEGGVGFAF